MLYGKRGTMMNILGNANKRKSGLAVVCSLFLAVQPCGCGREENILLIGTAGGRDIEMSADAGEEVPLLRKGSSDFAPDQQQMEQQLSAGQQVEQLSARPQMESEQETEAEDEMPIRIYVCGAVVNPGVVSVPEGSRVEDALLEAGGFTSEALRQALNLADWVYDGQMLYFPAEGEDLDSLRAGGWPEYGLGGRQGAGLNVGAGWNMGGRQDADGGFNTDGNRSEESSSSQTSGLVNINTADTALLITLPGIGESRARDIIAYREENGGFAKCEDIMRVSGIKTSVYEKICDRITVK